MSKKIDWSQTETIWASQPQIIAAWVFGSAQEGYVGEESDVDIAVLLEVHPSFEAQLDLLGQLQTALQLEAIDLVILNDANPILRFEAISGRPLFCRDAGRRAEFASLTAREYEDEMAQWQQAVRLRQ